MLDDPTEILAHKLAGGSIDTSPTGFCAWYDRERKLHRDDGPAITEEDGSCWWYQHGELHRIGAPAMTASNGDIIWSRHGLRHREDGPAEDFVRGSTQWHEVVELLEIEKNEIPKSAAGFRAWYLDGELLDYEWYRRGGKAVYA